MSKEGAALVIAPLRRIHGCVIAAMALVVLPLFLMAIRNRVPVAPYTISAALAPAVLRSDYPHTIRTLSLSGFDDRLALQLLASDDTPARHALEVSVAKPLKVPTPLLYWTPGESLQDGILIGTCPTVDGARIMLPDGVDPSRGSFILYSLGHAREVARVSIEEQP